MNDNASLALGQRSGLGGLPQRLVQDGVVEEAAMLSALQSAKDRKSSFVTQLISAGAAKARDIAIAASAEFGVPLYDLDSHQVDLDIVKLVQDKLAEAETLVEMKPQEALIIWHDIVSLYAAMKDEKELTEPVATAQKKGQALSEQLFKTLPKQPHETEPRPQP